jgi:hypothetical protein
VAHGRRLFLLQLLQAVDDEAQLATGHVLAQGGLAAFRVDAGGWVQEVLVNDANRVYLLMSNRAEANL